VEALALRKEIGFVGFCTTKVEARLHVRVLNACGIMARISLNKSPGRSYRNHCIWTNVADVVRAREVRRGFKTGLTMIGDPFDFMHGLRCGLRIYRKEMRKCVKSSTSKMIG
jgi:hypothetical protein